MGSVKKRLTSSEICEKMVGFAAGFVKKEWIWSGICMKSGKIGVERYIDGLAAGVGFVRKRYSLQ